MPFCLPVRSGLRQIVGVLIVLQCTQIILLVAYQLSTSLPNAPDPQQFACFAQAFKDEYGSDFVADEEIAEPSKL